MQWNESSIAYALLYLEIRYNFVLFIELHKMPSPLFPILVTILLWTLPPFVHDINTLCNIFWKVSVCAHVIIKPLDGIPQYILNDQVPLMGAMGRSWCFGCGRGWRDWKPQRERREFEAMIILIGGGSRRQICEGLDWIKSMAKGRLMKTLVPWIMRRGGGGMNDYCEVWMLGVLSDDIPGASLPVARMSRIEKATIEKKIEREYGKKTNMVE